MENLIDQADYENAINFFEFNSANSFYLKTFHDIWYRVFLSTLYSSVFIHVVAAFISFATLRKHKFGKFFPVFIVLLGIIPTLTAGAFTSAAIAFIYRASILPMSPFYAIIWGVGQTLVAAAIGFTRILATL